MSNLISIGNTNFSQGHHHIIPKKETLHDIVQVSGGWTFSVALQSNGEVLSWGNGYYGELGQCKCTQYDQSLQPTLQPTLHHDLHYEKSNPEKLDFPRSLRSQICKLSCGEYHTLALSECGLVFAWGNNAKGQIGRDGVSWSAVPEQIQSLENIVEIASGGNHSLAVDQHGSLYGWGDGSYGQCGANIVELENKTSCIPRKIVFKKSIQVASVAAGMYHSACIAKNGDLYTWGWGLYNQLGHGNVSDEVYPRRVETLQGVGTFLPSGHFTGMAKIDCGAWHCAAISTTGDVYTWGWGKDGQLCSESTMEAYPHLVELGKTSFQEHDSLIDEVAVDVLCGRRLTLIRTSSGKVYGYGYPLSTNPDSHLVSDKSMSIGCGSWHAFIIE